MTTILISTDEAGYGPNLGPLLIAGTSWAVGDPELDLFELLKSGVRNHHEASDSRLLIADSKQVYRSGNLAPLEQSVLAILHSFAGRLPESLGDLIQLISPSLSAQNLAYLRQQDWLKDFEVSFPCVADSASIFRLSERFSKTCRQSSVELRALECKILFSDAFNRELDSAGNKANLLSALSLDLVGFLLEQSEAQRPVQIGCDKHGGRSKYAALVQHHLAADFVNVVSESLEISEYQFRHRDRSVSIRFVARGESFLPTAMSSMIAKYLREIFMLAWNQFWVNVLPELKPTQGYPQDAKRFMREIDSARGRLGIARESIWRQR